MKTHSDAMPIGYKTKNVLYLPPSQIEPLKNFTLSSITYLNHCHHPGTADPPSCKTKNPYRIHSVMPQANMHPKNAKSPYCTLPGTPIIPSPTPCCTKLIAVLSAKYFNSTTSYNSDPSRKAYIIPQTTTNRDATCIAVVINGARTIPTAECRISRAARDCVTSRRGNTSVGMVEMVVDNSLCCCCLEYSWIAVRMVQVAQSEKLRRL